MTHAELLIFTLVMIVAIVAIRARSMMREQRFGILTMWVVPALFALITASIMVVEHITSPTDIAMAVLALIIGTAIGWYQGTHTTVRVDPVARAMFVKISPLGASVFLAVLIGRVLVRTIYASPTPGMPSPPAGPANVVSLMLLVFAVGVVGGLRLYLRQAYKGAAVQEAINAPLGADK